ncbi:RdgB/HAM1 family non-canonical purine NTP pyrophosphatase [Campylobacter sp. RKI_CA19_01122]|uniref:RdgB/HAM1 family non-canonical purine NTP pyrophosphatase n=1 Tax=Campylobacter sp. RKI_CA19_01122 TaxID=2911627 RepID=UPI0021E6B258|nr:RdgB/HAM1 family non-canonical purine NTP pyrophosphatase [Campylobacter sp. RKI_CA19_01122]EFO9213936.1 RdgB/HAM1 family non-canonical purine NTP pyrophosphatase [Campylobacter lari]EGK8030290.1 RdgB/HAM1 family non-canonical purine NTP pyrophosphatase [Campylobacter lari]MCV3356284.1 RdgB/HAM1 family non-canonical purine NTP pyrophosphatase [Campylobacter sp. RKI_CA19_01122]MCV3426130.1 RdgB/HAM1 family non-canonical purine NTP pyrophosphatase [Campylobacter lari]
MKKKLKIILATSNAHKVEEIKKFLTSYEIYALNEIITPFEIIEDGTSFKENALIKSKAIFNALDKKQNEFITLSDDSGISVEALDNAPGIFSARYSQEGTDEANRNKLIQALHKKNLHQSKAFYTAAIAISSKYGHFSTHGYMHGLAIDTPRGNNGFGYDPLFIPKGFDKTLGELDEQVKLKISHRSQALMFATYILRVLEKMEY